MALTARRCHYATERLPEWTTFPLSTDRFCPNYVNLKRPRKVYWERPKAERVCWAYVCDWCFEELPEVEDFWPTGADGRFKQSMECSLA